MPSPRQLLRRLTLSEAARGRLAHIVAGLLIAVTVVCVVIVIVELAKQAPSTPRTTYPTTRFSTTAPSQPGVYYKNCAEAHADGRWNIPADDPAYRPALDKDHNGIACESRKPG
ncbi:excalibur calcium-binding domain-containing protein [Mycobacterium sp. MUNTM1]